MNRKLFLCLLVLSYGMAACSGRVSEEQRTEEGIAEPETVQLVPIVADPMPTASFPDAMLEMYRPLGNEKFNEGKVGFEFNIKNHPFGSQRPIMLAINGSNPEEIPHAVFSKSLSQGTYRAVAYLTDEKGLMLKDFGNYVDRDFMVGDSRSFPAADEPYLVVNLPRDGASIVQGESLIVDFLVVWGDMVADGLEVRVTLDGFEYQTQKQETLELKNLPKGDHVIRLHLLRKDGKELLNAFSSVSRRISVK
ncbi:MAG: hypothetical protein JJU34_02010 [Lunatimonas sp.]|uniref:hypothetical protein n=1 Tax=Lunatimonas sp. TaxID=2060141 RepID=UPI00263B11AD|nr:hypothetical protein [Lunatimonas sp.]MCC5936033.1 hypothetical protein [Lunatimonas sp.]